MGKTTFGHWWALKFFKPEHKYAAEQAWQYLHAIKEQELSELRAQLASAQAEKAELVKALKELSHTTYEAWTSLSAAESNALKALIKDNQEVNKHE
jgi:hypothetical protein